MKRVVLAVLGLVALAALGAGGWLFWRWRDAQAFRATPFGAAPVIVEVPTGAGPQRLGRLLQEAGAISDAERLVTHLRWLRRHTHPKAGEYELKLPMTPDQIIDQLERGEILLHRFTVPEGLRLDEIAPLVGATGLCRSAEFLKLVRAEATAKRLGVPASSLEGYLFPDTYSVPKGIGCAGIAQAMVAGFRAAWAKADQQRAPEVKLTQAQAVTLASIVEKETAQPDERPRVSCVFHNRLRKKMRLGTDPTVIYATLLANDFVWDGNIHKSDLERDHPYNTYRIFGLPPGPIASPGLEALKAALRPLPCGDYYFVSRNDRTHEFCPDLACHEAAVRRYQLGGRRR